MGKTGKEDVYSCDFCGVEIAWEGSDDAHGEVWSCENQGCGKIFCSKCFIDRHGLENYMKMMQSCDFILCPECWEKRRQG